MQAIEGWSRLEIEGRMRSQNPPFGSNPSLDLKHAERSTLLAAQVPLSVSDSAATDKELVNAVRHGSRNAANELALRHLRSARTIALAITTDADAADDIARIRSCTR